MKPPCYHCPDRSVTCHGSCSHYAAFVAEREKIRQRRNAETDIDEIIIRNAVSRKLKWKNETNG